MAMIIDITEIERFAREEAEFQWKLVALQTKRSLNRTSKDGSPWMNAFNDEAKSSFAKLRSEAHRRNKAFLREVEVESAKLRSRAYFCPTELHLANLRRNYEAGLMNNRPSMER